MTAASSTEGFTATFELARRLRDPAVRQQLKDLGFDGEADVAVAYGPLETREEAIGRSWSDDGRRVLLAGRDASEPTGWRMQWLA